MRRDRTMSRIVVLSTLAVLVASASVSAVLWWNTNTAAAPPAQELKTLEPGWVNIPWMAPTAAIGSELVRSTLPNLAAIYYVDNSTGQWLRYFPDRAAISNLTTMTFGQSYLALLTAPTTVTWMTEDMIYGSPPAICPPSGPACPQPTPCPAPELVISPDAAVEALILAGAIVVAQDGQYLGELSCNTFASDSILNEFGDYGSPFSSTSIWNEFGQYGSEFSLKSAFSELTGTPPAIYVDDSFAAYLTINPANSPAIHPYEIPAYCWDKHP
jgi:hypothetical protein